MTLDNVKERLAVVESKLDRAETVIEKLFNRMDLLPEKFKSILDERMIQHEKFEKEMGRYSELLHKETREKNETLVQRVEKAEQSLGKYKKIEQMSKGALAIILFVMSGVVYVIQQLAKFVFLQ